MSYVMLILLILASACNVANTPSGVSSAGAESTTASTLQFGSPYLSSGEGVSFVKVSYSFSDAVDADTTITYAVGGTATGGAACGAGVDYVTPSGSLVQLAGTTTGVIDITICNDSVYEGTEYITLTLLATTPAHPIGRAYTIVGIVDSTTPPLVSFNLASSGSVVEGIAGVNTVTTVDLVLNHASSVPVTVLLYASGSATEGTDFDLSASSVTFAAGATTASVDVTTYGDDDIEVNETVILNLYAPVNGSLGTQITHQIQIAQDEVPSQVTASMAAIAAQLESAGTVNLTVNLTGVTDHAVDLAYTVDFNTAIGATRRADIPGDFYLTAPAGSSGVVSIPAGATSVTIPVTILDDSIYEVTEGLVITLLGGSEVAVSAGFESVELDITDDDLANQPLISFMNALQNVAEANLGGGAVIRLLDPSGSGAEKASGEDVVVDIVVANGTTEGAADWSMSLVNITIPAGQTRVTLPFTLLQDGIDEDDESFTFTISSSGGYTMGSLTTHTVTILDSDPAARITFELASSSVSEAAAGAYTVNVVMDRLSERTITLNYTSSGVTTSTTACGGSVDMVVPGTVTIPPSSVMPFALTGLTLCADALYEGDETMVLTLGSVTNAALGAAVTHTVTITEDDAVPDVAISAATTSFDEANTTVTLTITVQPTGKPFSLAYTTAGTASVGVDHNLAASGVVNVGASSGVQILSLLFQIIDDTTPENAETIIPTFTAGALDANVTVPSVTITINASDPLQLALGRRHTCGLLSGTVKCWGYGPVLGRGSSTDYGDDPGETVTALQGINLGSGFTPVKVVAGDDFSCALSSAGTVKCWGDNSYGQLGQDRGAGSFAIIGDSSTEMGSSLPAVYLGAVATDIQSSANAHHVCARLSSGRMKCWGDNSTGQLGYAFAAGVCGDTTADTQCVGDDYGELAGLGYVTFPTPGLTVTRMAVGDNHTCAQLSNNTVMCWGDNSNGALGVDSANAARYLTSAPYATAALINGAFTISTMTGISAATDKSCVTFYSAGANQSLCWGSGASGELGQGNVNDAGTVADPLATVATAIDLSGVAGTFTTVTGLRMGGLFACVRGNTGDVVCWGDDASGQMGNGAGATPVTNLATGTVLTPYSDVYVGDGHACAIDGAFNYSCWGQNDHGEAGAQVAAGTDIDAPPVSQLFQ